MALSTLVAIFMMAPWPRRRAAAFITATAVLGAIVLHSFPGAASLDVVSRLEALQGLGRAGDPARPPPAANRRDPGEPADDPGAAPARPRRPAGQTGGDRTVETNVAWAYDLDWSPFPVFQTYSAYTPKLDRLNAAAIEDPNGPQVLLRAMPAGAIPLGGRPGFGERQPFWDPPEQTVATVCNFVPTLTDGTWQVLSRIPDRCATPRPIASHSGEPGEAVTIPQAGPHEIVVLRLEGAEVEGLERLRLLFWRPRERHAVLEDRRYRYRLVPGTTGDGLIVSADHSSDGGVGFLELPVAKNISIEGADGPLQFDFYRIRLKPMARRVRVIG